MAELRSDSNVEGNARGREQRKRRPRGAPLAATTSMAALSLDLAALPLRMADINRTSAFRFLEAVVPPGPPGPASK